MNPSLEQNKSIRTRFIFFALLLLGTALRFYQLGRSLGGGDENQYLLDYGDTSLKYIATTYFFGGHPVFHTLLMRLMIMAFGDENALAIRMPAFISGIACLWLIYQVALQIFNSLLIARMALLFAALCPIHIYYSQIARGYSLMMFFSIAMVYAAIKLLDSPGFKWGGVLVACGVLSVYTVPTNVYFIVSLAVWIFAVILVPRWKEDHKTPDMASGKKAGLFLALFLLMAALSYLVYLPLVSQVIAEANNYHLAHEQETSKLLITGRVPTGTLALIFPGALAWFLPFLAVGIFFGQTRKPSYRLLPLGVFLLPLIVPLLTGVSGYPRNYLYNLPILIIFLSAGIAWAGKFMSQYLSPRYGKINLVIFAGYATVSSMILISDHYPSIAMPDGKLYQQKIRDNSQALDLIAITDPRNYLYAKSVYSGNLMNIIQQNRLTGIKVVSTDEPPIDDKSILPFIKEVINMDKLNLQPVVPGKKIFSLAGPESISLLPEDFESTATWKPLSGKGKVTVLEDRKFSGKSSIMMQAEEGQDMIVRTSIDQQVQLGKPAFIVLIWTKHGLTNPLSVLYQPMLTLQMNMGGAVREMQMRLEKINNGINLHYWKDSAVGAFDWTANSVIGRIPPGNYTFSMFLRCKAGESVVYDGFRLFFIEIPVDTLNVSLQESMKAK